MTKQILDCISGWGLFHKFDSIYVSLLVPYLSFTLFHASLRRLSLRPGGSVKGLQVSILFIADNERHEHVSQHEFQSRSWIFNGLVYHVQLNNDQSRNKLQQFPGAAGRTSRYSPIENAILERQAIASWVRGNCGRSCRRRKSSPRE